MTSLTATQIQALVRNMDESKRKHKKLKSSNPQKYRENLEKENETLALDLPSIFDMHFDDKLDETFFKMLKLKRDIELGKITEDEASRLIGDQLFKRYVDPVINNSAPPATTMTYSEFYKQNQK
jgi:uncharacterized short protein YbdD (DUF466 family)